MIIIGERINATRKPIREAIANRDADAIALEVSTQDKQGAHYIDLNAGTGAGDLAQEKLDLCWLIDCALAHTEKKLALDSADLAVLSAAVEHLGGRRPWMLNSVKYSATGLPPALALAAAHEAPVIGLLMGEDAIPREVSQRLDMARGLVAEAEARGIPRENLFLDPLAFPVSADITQGTVTLNTLRCLKETFPEVRTVMGLSNFSHGLQKRAEINRSFLVAAITHGLDAAICDPTRKSVRKGLLLGQLIAGKDRHCRRYSRAVRNGLFDDDRKTQGVSA